MAELAEKSLKMFLALSEQKDNALSHYASTYGHNIKKLREQAETFSESFSEQDIVDFSLVFDDKRGALFQHLRYGSQMTIDGYSTNLGTLMPIVEKIFFYSCLELPKEWKQMINFNSSLFHLLTNGRFDQSRNPKLILEAVRINNPFISEYENYCHQMNDEQEELRKKFEQEKNKD